MKYFVILTRLSGSGEFKHRKVFKLMLNLPFPKPKRVKFESQWEMDFIGTSFWTRSYHMNNMRTKFSLLHEWVELSSLGTQLFITDFSRRNLISTICSHNLPHNLLFSQFLPTLSHFKPVGGHFEPHQSPFRVQKLINFKPFLYLWMKQTPKIYISKLHYVL